MDRNFNAGSQIFVDVLSLSARRAWIEITVYLVCVVLSFRRSPQGERG